MNDDQTISVIRGILKIASGMLIARGVGDSALWEAITGGVIAIATLWWGYSHKKPNEPFNSI